MNVAANRNLIVDHLRSHGFSARDADPTDFQRNTDRALRFKVGTAYQEVTITVWNYSRQIEAIRVTSDTQAQEAIRRINDCVWDLDSKRQAPTS